MRDCVSKHVSVYVKACICECKNAYYKDVCEDVCVPMSVCECAHVCENEMWVGACVCA